MWCILRTKPFWSKCRSWWRQIFWFLRMGLNWQASTLCQPVARWWKPFHKVFGFPISLVLWQPRQGWRTGTFIPARIIIRNGSKHCDIASIASKCANKIFVSHWNSHCHLSNSSSTTGGNVATIVFWQGENWCSDVTYSYIHGKPSIHLRHKKLFLVEIDPWRSKSLVGVVSGKRESLDLNNQHALRTTLREEPRTTIAIYITPEVIPQ